MPEAPLHSYAGADAGRFYDCLATGYYLFSDTTWSEDVEKEGDYFAEHLAAHAVKTVLDCSSGPGTQALGLAARGFQVTASDISPVLIRELKDHARSRGLEIRALVGDMTELRDQHDREFDAVLSAGNALPHLGGFREVRRAISSMLSVTKVGGLVVTAFRDYRRILEDRPRFDFRQLHEDNAGRKLLLDLWDYRDDGIIDFTLMVLAESDGQPWRLEKQISTPLYPLCDHEVVGALENLGCKTLPVREYRWGVVVSAIRRE